MAAENFERLLQLDHNPAPFVAQSSPVLSRVDNPRLTFDIEEPSPAAHQDNAWRQPLRYDPQETPYEISTVRYKASRGELALSSSHNTMVSEAIRLDTQTPKTATEAARSLRAFCAVPTRASGKRKTRLTTLG